MANFASIEEALRRCAPYGMKLPRELLQELAEAYARPPRHYHTLVHVAAVAERYADVAKGPGWREPEAVYLAILAHDAIYEPGRKDNERRSAAFAKEIAKRYRSDADWVGRTAFLIEATASHHALPTGEDADLDHFLDCDLAILGASEDEYVAYAAGIRAEYAPIAGGAYDAGRATFLRSTLEHDSIFRSAFFRECLEQQARANVLAELAKLEG